MESPAEVGVTGLGSAPSGLRAIVDSDVHPSVADVSHRFVVDGAADLPLTIGAGRLAELLPASTLVWWSDQPYVQTTPSDAMDYMPKALAARIAGDNGRATLSRLARPGSVA